jgi:hypothetical protein
MSKPINTLNFTFMDKIISFTASLSESLFGLSKYISLNGSDPTLSSNENSSLEVTIKEIRYTDISYDRQKMNDDVKNLGSDMKKSLSQYELAK